MDVVDDGGALAPRVARAYDAMVDAHVRRGASAFGVALSATSPLLATADSLGSVLLWDLRSAGRGPFAEVTRDAAVHSLSFVHGVGGSLSELLVTGADNKLCAHETRTTSLATECSMSVLSTVLCVKAAYGPARLARPA